MPKRRKERVARARQADNPEPQELFADITELQRRAHRQTLDELAEILDSQKNRNFVQFYPAAFQLLNSLIENPKTIRAARLFILLAEHANRQNVLVATQHQLAQALNMSSKTVQRASSDLETANALYRIKYWGNGHAYCLSPNFVWRGKNDEKDSAPFVTMSLGKRPSATMSGPTTSDIRTITGPTKKTSPAAQKTDQTFPTDSISESDNGAEDDGVIYATDADIGLDPSTDC